MINSYYNRQPISHEQFVELCKKNFKAALAYNKLWRGTLVPITPIQKNILHFNFIKSFDIDMLQRDYANIQKSGQVKWDNKAPAGYEMTWTSITLKSYKGKNQPFLENCPLVENGVNPFVYTKNIDYCDYYKKILMALELIGCEIYLVRLLRLQANSFVDFHTDDSVFSNRINIIRCHIPIITNDKCIMHLGYPISKTNKPVKSPYKANILWSKFLEPGKIWYTNVNVLHAVENKSNSDRIHLVIDLKPNKDMLNFIYGL